MKNRKFIDTAKAYLQSGNGGNGCVSFRREKFVPKGGPDGGDGGRGGHVIIRADQNEDSLIKTYFQPHHKAETGGHGQGRRKHGANGRDHILTVPCGTQIFNYSSNELIADLVEHGQEIIAAKADAEDSATATGKQALTRPRASIQMENQANSLKSGLT